MNGYVDESGPPAAGKQYPCPPDPSICDPTYAAQVAQHTGASSCGGLDPRVVAGTCGDYQVWRRTLAGDSTSKALYSLTECIYDGSGAVVMSLFCQGLNCSYGGRVVELDACDLGPNHCPPTTATGDVTCYHSDAPPPVGTEIGCAPGGGCLPTYAEHLSVRRVCDHLGNPIKRQTGTCGGDQIWEEGDGWSFTSCAYDATGALELSTECDDEGCTYAGRVVRVDSSCALSPDQCAADGGVDGAADDGAIDAGASD